MKRMESIAVKESWNPTEKRVAGLYNVMINAATESELRVMYLPEVKPDTTIIDIIMDARTEELENPDKAQYNQTSNIVVAALVIFIDNLLPKTNKTFTIRI